MQLNSLAAVFKRVPYMFSSQFGDGLAGEKKYLDGGGRGMGRGGGWGGGGMGGRNRVGLDESKCSSRLVHPIDVFLIKF